ncbi:NAD+ synthase [bacterium]|nr:NAD+ synthase [bacterium]
METLRLSEEIVNWIKEKVKEAGKRGAVFGISGGLDSSLLAVLCKKALGDNALGLILPCHSHPEDEKYARLVAEKFGIKTERVVLDSIYEGFLQILPSADRIAKGNLMPRLRMATLYYFANKLNYLVTGSGNRSEMTIGYFTKRGDEGVDILPLGSLLKKEVRGLAKELGVQDEIIKRTPSAGLWEGQTDEGEIGISYANLDKAIVAIESHNRESLPGDLIAKVEALIKSSQHKRSPAIVFRPGHLDKSQDS